MMRGKASGGASRGRLGRATLPHTASFWLAAAVFFLVFAVSAAPSPLYGVYQAEWKFSAITLTAVFAIYAFFLLVGLLFFGSLSDHLGRRGVISGALFANTVACVLFLTAHGIGQLFVARAFQGVAVGVATSALGAALIDLQPAGSGLAPVLTTAGPLWGVAVGGLGTSALVQYGPSPTHLVWWLLLGASFVGGLGILTIPETSVGRPGVLASLRPSIGIPSEARSTFATTAPIYVAPWALNGFYLSLGPSLAEEVLHSRNLLWGGLVIFVLTGFGGTASVVFRARSARTTMMTGCSALVAGAAITFGAVAATSAVAFLVGTGVAGIGVGLAFLGSFRVLSALASPGQRASLISVIFIASYTAFSIPVVIAGVATSHFGLHRTALVYSAVIAALVGLALLSLLLPGRAPNGTFGPALPEVRLVPNTDTGDHESAHRTGRTANQMSDASGLQKIVVGIDSSMSSIDALRWAVQQAQLTGSIVQAVMAWQYPPAGAVPSGPADLDVKAESRQFLDAAIEGVISGASPIEVTRVVEEGEPGPTLVRASKDAALLVVGNRGHGELVGMLIGSVSQYCVTHAHCPVVVLRGPAV
jgi:nucleotide-binding universal stress UspA family protein/predicted MFS family arabinose efflux permease